MSDKHPAIWVWSQSPYLTMHSDGNQFIAQIEMRWGGFCSVGYSNPNFAWVSPKCKVAIAEAIEKMANSMEFPDNAEECIPMLLSLCKEANGVYNEFIERERTGKKSV